MVGLMLATVDMGAVTGEFVDRNTTRFTAMVTVQSRQPAMVTVQSRLTMVTVQSRLTCPNLGLRH